MSILEKSTGQKWHILADPTLLSYLPVIEIGDLGGRRCVLLKRPDTEDIIAYLELPDNSEEATGAAEIESALQAVIKGGFTGPVFRNIYPRASGSPGCKSEYDNGDQLENVGELFDTEQLTKIRSGIWRFLKKMVFVPGPIRDALNRWTQTSVVDQEILGDILARASQKSHSWREEGKLSPVTNQGMKKICWALANIGFLEAKYFIENDEKLQLSIDNLLFTCTVDGSDNYPYSPERALRRIEETGIQGECMGETLLFKSKGIVKVSVDDEDEIKMAVSQNPVVAIIVPTPTFQNFLKPKDTILHFTETDYKWFNALEVPVYHAVVITGWGVKNGEPVWEVQNSYGENYRDGGFFYMARGSAIKQDEFNPLIDVLYVKSFKKVQKVQT